MSFKTLPISIYFLLDVHRERLLLSHKLIADHIRILTEIMQQTSSLLILKLRHYGCLFHCSC